MKVLLNAESFGFGPSAAIAGLFPYIRNCDFIKQLDYVGTDHSVDLQNNLSYDNIYSLEDNEEGFKKLVVSYDTFITALDFEKATWAQEVGVNVIIYDTLLWYWRKLPPVIYHCSSYIVQDFYGVKERLLAAGIENYTLVPPSIQPKKLDGSLLKAHSNKDLIVINFGGLENPHWDVPVTATYIARVLDSLLPLLKGKEIRVACSKAHIPYLKNYPVGNYTYAQMQDYLARAQFLVATPGLGNIYEAANYGMPSLFLPPANDSQGQQLAILHQRGLIDNSIDWSELDCPIDYCKPQLTALEGIEKGIMELSVENLQALLVSKLFIDGNKNLGNLIQQFGLGGTEMLGQQVVNDLRRRLCITKLAA